MLRFGSVTIPGHMEPPSPVLTPRQRIVNERRGTGSQPTYREDWGLATNRPLRFVSSETQGFLSPTEVQSLMTLYESGAPFALETDLLGPLGGPSVTFTAYFDPETIPSFPAALPGRDLYRMDIVVRIT